MSSGFGSPLRAGACTRRCPFAASARPAARSSPKPAHPGGPASSRPELNAELLEDTPGALWSHAIIDAMRQAAAPQLARIVVAIDPAVSSGEDADETGIIVVGKDHQGHGYVLADASGKHQPIEWARIAVAAYRAHHADRIVAERNNGGAMVEATIRMVDGNVPVTTVWASRGKAARAEPVSALYEQGRVHHIGTFSKLEDQMCAFTSDFDRALAGPAACLRICG
jgi:phage terminase large subunit-like protein